MRNSTSKSEALVLIWIGVGLPILGQGRATFSSGGVQVCWGLVHKGEMEQEIERWIGAVSAVMWMLKQSVMVKREVSQNAKLSIYRSIYVPALTYRHELWVETERMRLWIEAAKRSFLHRVAGLSLRDKVMSSDLWVELLLPHVEKCQLRWFRHLVRMSPGRLTWWVFRACPWTHVFSL